MNTFMQHMSRNSHCVKHVASDFRTFCIEASMVDPSLIGFLNPPFGFNV